MPMPDIIVVRPTGFQRGDLGGGASRWTAPELARHGVHVTLEAHPPGAAAHLDGGVLYITEGDLRLEGRKTPVTMGSILVLGESRVSVGAAKSGVKWLHLQAGPALADGVRVAAAARLRKMEWTPLPGNRFMRQRVAIGAEGYQKVSFVQADILNFGRITPAAPQVLFVTGGTLRVNDQFCRKGGVVFVPAGTTYWPTGIADVVTYLRVGT